MSETYDCIVLGVGGFGSGALYHLAGRGVRALGLERFDTAHDRGSSHGQTRIIRKAYFEHPDYVPLLFRAYELWNRLEAETGAELMQLCGLMLSGPPQGEAITGARISAELHGLPIERIELGEARRRFPGFVFPDDCTVVFEAEAGYLHVEDCVRAHTAAAVARGAVLKTNETVTGWESDGETVRVRTDRGDYAAARLIVTAGAWTGPLLADWAVPLQVVRKPVFWYETAAAGGGEYDVARGCPAYYFEMPEGAFYGFPAIDGRTVKVAEHTGGETVSDPLSLNRALQPGDDAAVSAFVTRTMPGVRPTPVQHSVCMYTNTPDRHFLIDRHRQYANVIVGAGFSGHGFKFTSALGEALADLALQDRTDLPVGFLGWKRFD